MLKGTDIMMEVLTALAALTVRWLSSHTDPANNVSSTSRIIVCTGERMEDLIVKLYPSVQTTTFEPRHKQDRLSNAFRCYANYECGAWLWRQKGTP